jgi:hypothetical protein
MKTIKFLTALFFSVMLGMLFASVTEFSPFIVIPFVFAGLFLASRFAPEGVLGMDFIDMNYAHPIDNMAGVQSVGYIARYIDIAVWPGIPVPDTPVGMELVGIKDCQILTGNLTMKPGKYFFPFRMDVDDCEIVSTDVGKIGGISQKYTLKVKRADLSAKMRGFIRATNCQDLVFAIPDAQGVVNFLGSAGYPVQKMPEGQAGTGTGPEGESATVMNFRTYGNGPVPILPKSIVIPLYTEES